MVEIPQRDPSKLGEWATLWLMEFVVDKYTVMHIGGKFQNYSYTLQASTLTVSTKEGDLGITVDSSVKISAQCGVVVKESK